MILDLENPSPTDRKLELEDCDDCDGVMAEYDRLMYSFKDPHGYIYIYIWVNAPVLIVEQGKAL